MIRPVVLEVRLLGRFVVLRAGREIAPTQFGGRKVRALVRVLASRRGSFVSHDALTDMLWGEHPPRDPVANLQVLINRARHALDLPGLLVTGDGAYSMALLEDCVVDSEEFLAAVAVGDRSEGSAALTAFEQALRRWEGEPLPEDMYTSWAADYRGRLVRARQHALERGAELALELGRPATAVELATVAASAEPLRENAVLVLVLALAAEGDRAAALERFEHYRLALADELGLDPSAGAAKVHMNVLRGSGSATRTQHAPPPSTTLAPLPFVGRVAELNQALSVLRGGGIVLLSGASGTGKSRLLAHLSKNRRMVIVRAFLAERDEPWSVVRNLLREVLAVDATLGDDLPAAILRAVSWLLPELDPGTAAVVLPDPESRRSLLSEAVLRLLSSLGADVAVDDLQWADVSSLSVLETMIERLDNVGTVIAFRPDLMPDRPAITGSITRVRPGSTTIALQPFAESEIDELVADRALSGLLSASTDRTPFAVTEVLRTMAGEGALARRNDHRWVQLSSSTLQRASEVALQGQRTGIVARVATQDSGRRELMSLLALMARETPARVLADAANTSERTALERLAALSRMGLTRLGEQGWPPRMT